jgi:hypothetical protein
VPTVIKMQAHELYDYAERDILPSDLVPYPIGVSMVGGVVEPVLEIGAVYPASAEATIATIKDNQTEIILDVVGGDHLLEELGDAIGKVEVHGVPPLPRGQAEVVCHVEMDQEGNVTVSAKDKKTGKVTTAKFQAPIEKAGEKARPGANKGEVPVASARQLRANIELAVERAERIPDEAFLALTRKWRQWLAENKDGAPRLFEEKRREAELDFHNASPSRWPTTFEVSPDLQFSRIFPLGAGNTNEGAAILRFFTKAQFSQVFAKIEDPLSGAITQDFESYQFLSGSRLETIMRVVFPSNGNFLVSIWAATPGGQAYRARERSYGGAFWRFSVRGAPAPKRRLCQLIKARPFSSLPSVEGFSVEPGAVVIKLRETTTYRFVCKYQGQKLVINGREPTGASKQVLFPVLTATNASDGWTTVEGSITFPREGVWRVLYWVEGKEVGSQTIVAAAGVVPLTVEERAAFDARIP